jgi:hypothetical protein
MEIEKQPENFNINQDFNVKIKLKDRLKLLFGGKLSASVITTVKESPEVLNSSLTIKI